MIERSQVEGRPATIAWLKNGIEPATEADATALKVIFDDGEVRFGFLPIRKDFNPNQARDDHGRWTSSGGGLGPTYDEAVDMDETEAEFLVAEAHKRLFNASIGRTPTDAEREAVFSYSGTTYYEVNARLRNAAGANQVSTPLDRMKPDYIATLDATQAGLDSLFAGAKLDQDLVVYRRVSENGANRIAQSAEFIDHGFVSTTIDPGSQDLYGSDRMLRIELPKGSRALPIAHIADIVTEREVLVNRGSTFTVRMEGGAPVLTLK